MTKDCVEDTNTPYLEQHDNQDINSDSACLVAQRRSWLIEEMIVLEVLEAFGSIGVLRSTVPL